MEFIGDRSLRIREDESILDASLAAGIPHYHACGGNARCSTCRVLVKQGAENLSVMTASEIALRNTIPIPSDVRLACQTYIKGPDVKIHRIIRDESDVLIYTTDKNIQNQMGEERELALFFLDIREFTPFMETYLPFDVIHILRRLFLLFRKNIEDHDGRIIETAGDGFYAVFGFETDVKKAACNAVEAGKSLLRELEIFNETYMDRHFDHTFCVGIGIHAGPAIVGNIGVGVNNNLTVMGLAVNIASRLQAATKENNNSFIISDRVQNLLDTPISSSVIDINLKGISQPVRAHLVGKAYV